MVRFCSHCLRQFTPDDLLKDESHGMEAERKALGLQGVRFVYYACPECERDDIFVDVLPLAGESAETFQTRRRDLETAVRELHAPRVEVVLTTR